MADKHSLKLWIVDALRELGGEGTVVEVCREVWSRHASELEASGDIFFTWQYDIRWAAQDLRDRGVLVREGRRRNAPWLLASLPQIPAPPMA